MYIYLESLGDLSSEIESREELVQEKLVSKKHTSLAKTHANSIAEVVS